MLDGYLSVRQSCASCGESLHHHRADDVPAYVVILIVGKVLIAALLAVEVALAPPLWFHWALWPALTLLMTLWLLPRVKGSVVAFQWATRMHGFGGSDR
jgi:uncharacterized protein (DUF983 family)